MPPMTEKAMRIVSATLKHEFRTSRQAAELNALRVAEYLREAEEDMTLMAQLLREQETAAVVERLTNPAPLLDIDTPAAPDLPPTAETAFEPQLLEDF